MKKYGGQVVIGGDNLPCPGWNRVNWAAKYLGDQWPLWSPRFRHHCYMSSSHFFKNSFFTKFYLFSFSARLTNEKCQFILSKKDSLQPLKNMHKLATVSYTVSQCGRKVCFITSLYSQVTRPCFLKEKKVFASNWRHWWTRNFRRFLFAPHQSYSFIITTNPILFIKREKEINIEKLDWFAINASSISRDCYQNGCFERSLFPLSSLVKFILYSEIMVRVNSNHKLPMNYNKILFGRTKCVYVLNLYVKNLIVHADPNNG